MYLKLFIYIFAALASIIFYILFVGKLSFYLMIFMFALPVALGIILISGRFLIKYNLKASSDIFEKNSDCQFNLTIHNKSFFPFPSARVFIEFKNSFSENTGFMEIAIPIHARKKQNLAFNLSSQFCGILNAEITKIQIYDYLKLFCCSIKNNAKAWTYIVPGIDTDIKNITLNNILAYDNDTFSKYKSGDDNSEIFELKDYEKGDKLNRIHWNLSAKQGNLITKHYSQPTETPVTVIVDLNLKNSNLYSISCCLEYFYAISYGLIENQINHSINVKGFPENFTICNTEQLNECFITTLSAKTEEMPIENISSKSKIFLVTNKDYDSYLIPETADICTLKCFFTGNTNGNYNTISNEKLEIVFVDNQNHKIIPNDILI